MTAKHGEYCFRCGKKCNMSIVTEVPEGGTLPTRYEVFTCPTCPGIQAKKDIGPEPHPPAELAVDELDAAHTRLRAAVDQAGDGSGTGRYGDGPDHWTQVSDGRDYPPTQGAERIWPTPDQQKALAEQHKTS